MKILTVALFLAALVTGAYAQDTLVTFPPNTKPGAVGFQAIGGPGNYTFQIARRDGPAGVEIHKNWTYVFAVQAGDAIFNYGGQVENAQERDKKVDDGEFRGSGLIGRIHTTLSLGKLFWFPQGCLARLSQAPERRLASLL